LHIAAAKGHAGVVNVLLEHGADIQSLCKYVSHASGFSMVAACGRRHALADSLFHNSVAMKHLFTLLHSGVMLLSSKLFLMQKAMSKPETRKGAFALVLAALRDFEAYSYLPQIW
jgi:predicted naringenin-chalcone synthase